MPEETPRAQDEKETVAPTEAAEDAESLKQALTEQRKQAETYLANWQRAGADLANYKKKAEQERQETVAFANAMLVAGLLPVLDDLERALQTVDARMAGLNWVDGIRHIYRKLATTLETEGLKTIPTAGQTFDPRIHEAVMEVEGEEGKVVGELQKGYKFRDRVVRSAMVQVGRKQAPAQASAGHEPTPVAYAVQRLGD